VIGNSDVLRKLLLELEDEAGRLTPEHVVEAARNPESPLHQEFTWNNDAAAENWRLHQARHLVRTLLVTVVTSTTVLSIPAYLRDPTLPKRQQGYINTARVDRGTQEAREIVRTELARTLGNLQRASAIGSVLGLDDEIGQVIAQVEAIRDRRALQ
jgi:hypothetical protein